MIDVSGKSNTLRYAKAEGRLDCASGTLETIRAGEVPKGDLFEIARAAGITAAKRTSDSIVFCHPIPLDWIEVTLTVEDDHLAVTAEVRSVWKTGVEMEALTAVSGALLNAFDMLKPLDDTMSIGEIRIIEKRGGKSDWQETFTEPIRCAVLVISDSTHAGERKDRSGLIIQEALQNEPVDVIVYEIVPDDRNAITGRLSSLADSSEIDLIITTGGTGLGPKDITPEATMDVIDREVPGIIDTIRAYGAERTPRAMLSRSRCGLRGETLIINLPGSSRGAGESMAALLPGLLHAFPMIRGGGHAGD
ncbi:bifunctional molybdenum cofactor biosynthesis protein MoaC/MoaB [Candidatus Zixiibacteriota bacterium]